MTVLTRLCNSDKTQLHHLQLLLTSNPTLDNPEVLARVYDLLANPITRDAAQDIIRQIIPSIAAPLVWAIFSEMGADE